MKLVFHFLILEGYIMILGFMLILYGLLKTYTEHLIIVVTTRLNLKQNLQYEGFFVFIDIYRGMKLIDSISQLITEASKKQILMDKVGFDEENADLLDKLCGPLSVWMGNKIIEFYLNQYSKMTQELTPEELKKVTIQKINDNMLVKREKSNISSIMDWVRVGLNGNLGENKELSFRDLYLKSREWHDSLDIGQGDINYKEENPTILDFTDENGNGFYWADLNTKNSPEECERMGHCGRSSYGYLYSLRQVIPINNKYKLNKSVLTAAIGEDGILYQLKGPKNSKPKDEYHQYIEPLFFVTVEDVDGEDYLIQGFGTEYASEQDFKLSDLPEETIKDLYQKRPDLFSSRTMQRLLGKMGIIEVEPLPTTFTLEIKPEDFEDYIDGGWDNTYTNRTTGTKRRVHIFEEIMEGDAWGLWNNDGYEDLSGYFQYTIDKETEERLWDIVRKTAQRDDVGLDEDLDLEDAIKEVDDDWEIRNAIGSAINDADADDYVNYLQDLLKTALEEYGNVYEFNYTGAKIQVDLSSFVDVDDQNIDEMYENNIDRNGKYNLEGVLREIIDEGYLDKPDFNYYNRWYPSPNDSDVNELVNDRLSEIDI